MPAAVPRPVSPWPASCSFASSLWSAIRSTTPSSAGAAASRRRARPSPRVPRNSSASLARTRGRGQPFQCGRSRSDRWSPVTDSLFETPTLDDPGSSRIERDIMRRRPCANGWLVDRCPGPRPPELVLDLRLLGGDATVWPPLRPTILSQLCDRLQRRSQLGKEELPAKPSLTPRPFSWIDPLIRPQQERRWDRQAESFGGPEVDDQLELRGLLNRQIGGVGALEN